MAYFYHDSETGEAGYGGEPSKEERHHGKQREDEAEELDPHEIDQME